MPRQGMDFPALPFAMRPGLQNLVWVRYGYSPRPHFPCIHFVLTHMPHPRTQLPLHIPNNLRLLLLQRSRVRPNVGLVA